MMSKLIGNHPAVEELLDGESQGFDYKYHVWLKEDWRFSNGRMEGCRTGNFQNVKDFFFAKPVRVSNEQTRDD